MSISSENGKLQTKLTDHTQVIDLMVLSKLYQQGSETVRAVDEVSLQVKKGEFLTITGRSGSGKTTLLSLIGGLTFPSAGSVKLFGQNLVELDDAAISELRACRIGFVFQFPSLIPTLSALENVLLPSLFSKQSVSNEEANRLLSWVSLGEKTYSYPAQLSGGQQARVALARALSNQPDLLLADEPTGNLDVETEREVLALLREINLDKGTTILLVTHNPELARFGNRHLVMDSGRLSEMQHWASLEAVRD